MPATTQKPLSVEVIVLAREHLAVDPTSPSGLRWRSHWSRKHQTRFAGGPAGNRRPNSYWKVCIAGRHIYAHRLIWFLETGIDTAQYGVTVDHVNRDKGDNRIENLRTATDGDQIRNQSYRTRPGRKIGESGFRWVKRNGNGWLGQFGYKGKLIHCGRHATPEEARKVVLSRRRSMGLSLV